MEPQGTEVATEIGEYATEPLLKVEGLTKSFGAQPLWQDVSFILKEGETLSICGVSGSGKSTLLLAIGGIEDVQSGKIEFCGHPVIGGRQTCVEDIGYVFQHYHLIEELSVRENLLLPFSSFPFSVRSISNSPSVTISAISITSLLYVKIIFYNIQDRTSRT